MSEQELEQPQKKTTCDMCQNQPYGYMPPGYMDESNKFLEERMARLIAGLDALDAKKARELEEAKAEIRSRHFV